MREYYDFRIPQVSWITIIVQQTHMHLLPAFRNYSNWMYSIRIQIHSKEKYFNSPLQHFLHNVPFQKPHWIPIFFNSQYSNGKLKCAAQRVFGI